jgi:WD40 repeat protein
MMSTRRYKILLLIALPVLLAGALMHLVTWRPRVIGTAGGEKSGDNAPMAAVFSPDGATLAISRQRALSGRDRRGGWAYATNKVELVDVKSGAVVRELYAPRKVTGAAGNSIALGPFRSLHYSPDGRALVGITVNGDLALMSIPGGRSLAVRRASWSPRIPGYRSFLYRFIGFVPRNHTVLLTEQWRRKDSGAGTDAAARILHRANIVELDYRSGKSVSRRPLSLEPGEWPERVGLMPDGKTVVCSTELGDESSSMSRGGKILTFDAYTGQRTRILKQGHAETRALACSPTGSLVAASWDALEIPRGAALFDVARNRTIALPVGQQDVPVDLTFSPDGKLLAGISNGTINMWDTRTGTFERSLGGAPSVTSLQFSPEGQTLAAVDWKVVKVWRVK